MKRTIAISLLLLHLFSLYGNFVVHAYCVFQSDKFFEEQISKDKYKLDDLVEVKLPMKMPCIQDWKSFSPINGQVHLENGSYNYVKLKMTRDTIFLMCIPNYKTTTLCQQNIIDARGLRDVPFNKKDHVPFTKTNNIGIFNYQVPQYTFCTPAAIFKKAVRRSVRGVIKYAVPGPSQPPDRSNGFC